MPLSLPGCRSAQSCLRGERRSECGRWPFFLEGIAEDCSSLERWRRRLDRRGRPFSFLREDCALARSRFFSLRCKVWVEVELCEDEEEEVVEGFFFL